MRRVAFTGASGAGKTTLAGRLAGRLNVPLVDLERLPDDRIADTLALDSWVSDATHESQLGDLVLERADTLVWLDPPLMQSLSRQLRRDRLDIGLGQLVGAVAAKLRNRSHIPCRAARHPHLRLLHLRSDADAELLLTD